MFPVGAIVSQPGIYLSQGSSSAGSAFIEDFAPTPAIEQEAAFANTRSSPVSVVIEPPTPAQAVSAAAVAAPDAEELPVKHIEDIADTTSDDSFIIEAETSAAVAAAEEPSVHEAVPSPALDASSSPEPELVSPASLESEVSKSAETPSEIAASVEVDVPGVEAPTESPVGPDVADASRAIALGELTLLFLQHQTLTLNRVPSH